MRAGTQLRVKTQQIAAEENRREIRKPFITERYHAIVLVIKGKSEQIQSFD